MKLIIAIVRDADSESISQALIKGGFRVTRTSSTGGFFRRGSTTLMAGVEDNTVEAALNIFRQSLGPASESGERRATLFVLPVESFTQV